MDRDVHPPSSIEITKVAGASQRTANRVLRLPRLTGSMVERPLEIGRLHLLVAHDVRAGRSCQLDTTDSTANVIYHLICALSALLTSTCASYNATSMITPSRQYGSNGGTKQHIHCRPLGKWADFEQKEYW